MAGPAFDGHYRFRILLLLSELQWCNWVRRWVKKTPTRAARRPPPRLARSGLFFTSSLNMVASSHSGSFEEFYYSSTFASMLKNPVKCKKLYVLVLTAMIWRVFFLIMQKWNSNINKNLSKSPLCFLLLLLLLPHRKLCSSWFSVGPFKQEITLLHT